MGNIAQNKQGAARKAALPGRPQAEAVQQGLGGMGVPAVAAVNHAAGQQLRQKARRAAAGMADDNDVRPHGLQGQARILEAFAFI